MGLSCPFLVGSGSWTFPGDNEMELPELPGSLESPGPLLVFSVPRASCFRPVMGYVTTHLDSGRASLSTTGLLQTRPGLAPQGSPALSLTAKRGRGREPSWVGVPRRKRGPGITSPASSPARTDPCTTSPANPVATTLPSSPGSGFVTGSWTFLPLAPSPSPPPWETSSASLALSLPLPAADSSNYAGHCY